MRLYRQIVLTVALALLLGLMACFRDLSGPTTDFTPPPEWRAWYAEVAACAVRRGDFDRLRWGIVHDSAGRGGFETGGAYVLGVWRPPHTILLGQDPARPSMSLEDLVRHEMLHDLLGGPVDGVVHPAPPFGLCADL